MLRGTLSRGFSRLIKVSAMTDSYQKCEVMLKKIEEECKSRGLPDFLRREFTAVSPPEKTGRENVPKIRLLQWNVLAYALAKGADNFIRCPEKALSWETRKLRILEGILKHNPDVICLEEVDHYDYLSSHLTPLGYSGIFHSKPYSPCLNHKDNIGPDGCALFYRKDCLQLLESHKFILKTDNDRLTNQVAIHCTFKIINCGAEDGKDEFSVIVTHLKAKDGFEKLRYEEGKYILYYIHQRRIKGPIIICGDFNADPFEKIYDTFVKDELRLLSAYTKLSDKNIEPPYTTWKVRGSSREAKDICRTVDYIWCSQRSLEILSLLNLPTEEDVGKNRLPSHSYPSDHLSLVCDFRLT
ncbi:nocturnin-like isoform X1 [Argonauta hians]